MTLVAALQLVETVAIVAGVVFGLVQLRHLRRQRDSLAAMELWRSLQTPTLTRGMTVILDLPADLSVKEVRATLGEDNYFCLLHFMSVWEGLGPLIVRGDLDLDRVDDYFGGMIAVSWQKLRHFVAEQREALGYPTFAEWLQWLAERTAERAPHTKSESAFVKYARWRSPADYRAPFRGKS